MKEKQLLTTWIVKYKAVKTGNVNEDKFTAASAAEARSAFHECYRHDVYEIISVEDTGKL